ncbi:MAG: type I methionyl aminopeptidase [Acidimicrobiales bacterium]
MTAAIGSEVDIARLGPNDPCWCGSGNKFKRCHRPSTDRIQPGQQSPRRSVPPEIERPFYADTGERSHRGGNPVQSTDVIDRMRRTCRLAGDVLGAVGEAITPGVTTNELDELCHRLTIEAGAYPSPLNYGNFPKSLCTSVNEVICHGIPDDRALRDGDIVNLDVTVFREGVHGDTNATWCVGTVDPRSRRLVRVTRECLERAIDVVRPGQRLYEVGRAIQQHAEEEGFAVVRAFIGHGIGEEFHTDFQVLHYFDRRNDIVLKPGMVFTIEPMIAEGAWQHRLWDDDWTAVTTDGKRTAQFEHTLLVTDDGVDILTLRSDGKWSGSEVPLEG